MSHDDVEDHKTFADYVRQELGTPRPTGNRWAYLNKELKEFWAKYPDATWGTLTRGVATFKDSRFRPDETGMVVRVIGMLCAKGEISMATAPDIDKDVLTAVQQETDRSWQLKLLGATGKYKDAVLEEWREEREHELG
jgi:hypothetical protein